MATGSRYAVVIVAMVSAAGVVPAAAVTGVPLYNESHEDAHDAAAAALAGFVIRASKMKTRRIAFKAPKVSKQIA